MPIIPGFTPVRQTSPSHFRLVFPIAYAVPPLSVLEETRT